jgi:hypothetical protein
VIGYDALVSPFETTPENAHEEGLEDSCLSSVAADRCGAGPDVPDFLEANWSFAAYGGRG